MSLISDIRLLIKDYFDYKKESKNWIQFDIALKLFPLDEAINTSSITFNYGDIENKPVTKHKYVAEIICKFTNKGKVPFNLYNLQVWLSTLKTHNDDGKPREMFDNKTGRFKLGRIFTSGNLLDSFTPNNINDLQDKSSNGFIYIGPQVEQVMSFLVLISETKEIIQVNGMFSLEGKRIFPSSDTGEKKLLPHTASTIYKIGEDGFLMNGAAK